MKFIVLLCLLFSQFVFGQVLILQFSDTHSAYDNIGTFTQNIYQQINEFKELHPQGEVLFIHSGDISGVGEFTQFDKGLSNYDYFAKLVKDYHFTLTMGNHDGADWDFQTLLDQTIYFEQVMSQNNKQNWKMLAANIKVNDSSIAEHFSQYQDINLKDGKKIRVVGLVLDELLSYTHRSVSRNLEVESMISAAKRHMKKALSHGVDRIIFSAHEELNKPNMQRFEKQLATWINKNPQYKSIKRNLIFSAHDHSVQIYNGVHSKIISSGSSYKYFSKTLLDKDLSILDLPQHIETSLPQPQATIPLEVKASLVKLQTEIDKVNELNNRVIANNPIRLDERGLVKLRPHHNGIIISNAFREWAKSEVSHGLVLDYIAFFNSGSYRAFEPIEAGDFTYGDIRKIAPFTDTTRIFLAKGSQIQSAFTGLRMKMSPEHTPQLPSNIREIPLGSNILHRLDKVSNKWVKLEANALFAIALDGWLSTNGFNIKEFDKLFELSQEVKPSINSTDTILQKFLPQILEEEALQIKADCDKLYLNP